MDFKKDDKKKNEMTEIEAQDLILKWAKIWKVNTKRATFKDVLEELVIPVIEEDLIFDSETRTFKYKLFDPIVKRDNSGSIDLINITSTDMQDKKDIQRFKEEESVDMSIVLIAKYCNIEPGFASRIKDPDMSVINAVITGFFGRAAAPSRAR